jgi:hypothetical protein
MWYGSTSLVADAPKHPSAVARWLPASRKRIYTFGCREPPGDLERLSEEPARTGEWCPFTLWSLVPESRIFIYIRQAPAVTFRLTETHYDGTAVTIPAFRRALDSSPNHQMGWSRWTI